MSVRMARSKKLKLDDHFAVLRQRKSARWPRSNKRGITEERVANVLAKLARDDVNIVDVVMALLDDGLESQFSRLAKTHTFADGATIAHLACHVGILQRGKTKLDREGRDYWIKPLRELGAVEPITLPKGRPDFVEGHIKAKSPTSAYRLAPEFVSVLSAPEAELDARLKQWAADDARVSRLALQAKAAAAAKKLFANDHAALIAAIIDYYQPAFLPGFEVIYVDQDDGDRVTAAESKRLAEAGIKMTLEDASPDVIFFHFERREMAIAEAVTSDGEVDAHKLAAVSAFARRHELPLVDAVTAYRTWSDAAKRQARMKNLAPGSRLWIQEDGAKRMRVEAAFPK